MFSFLQKNTGTITTTAYPKSPISILSPLEKSTEMIVGYLDGTLQVPNLLILGRTVLTAQALTIYFTWLMAPVLAKFWKALRLIMFLVVFIAFELVLLKMACIFAIKCDARNTILGKLL
ncbi:hypothetical protein HDK64DRAFT_258525 [Phyllosticta capitalensis]